MRTVRRWLESDETMLAKNDEGNFRVYQWEDGDVFSGLFRDFEDGKLHMDAGLHERDARDE